MSHELDETTGKAAMAYVGARGWHGLGNALTAGATIEEWQEEAGMQFTILESDVQYRDQEKKLLVMPDRKLLFRDDTRAALSVVGSGFNIVQPSEVLEFFRDLVGTAGFTLETAGVLFGGRKFWALAKCGSAVKILGVDEVKPYLLLATACDGSMASTGHFTSVRVVCDNTLRMALGAGHKAQVRIPHSTEFDPAEMKSQLGIADEQWERFLANITKLAKKKLHRDDAIDIVAAELRAEWREAKFGDAERQEALESSMALRSIIALFDGAGIGMDNKATKGTAWGLVNAVTEYYDHSFGSKTNRSRAFERATLTDKAAEKVRIANALLLA